MSMIFNRANGALLGTIASLIVACLCGYGPSLAQGRQWSLDLGGGNLLGLITLQDISYSRWANGAHSFPTKSLCFFAPSLFSPTNIKIIYHAQPHISTTSMLSRALGSL